MQALSKFIESQGISMTCQRVDHNPNMDDPQWAATASHWRCTIRKGEHRLTIPFSQGSAHTEPPTVAEVLDCLASDASGYESSDGFEDWASGYGYGTDSRKAEQTYRVIGTQAGKLKRLLGDNAYTALLWECERL